MIQKSWQQLSVSECFARFAWQGGSVAMAPMAITTRPTTWQTTCVEDFFGRYNWSGRSRQQLATAVPESAPSFSITMPVQQFFDCFAWAGKPVIAPPAVTSTPIPIPNQVALQSIRPRHAR